MEAPRLAQGGLTAVVTGGDTSRVTRFLALGMALFVLVTGTLPHVHEEGGMGQHACPACALHDGERAPSVQADAGPRIVWAETVELPPVTSPVTGAPRDAVPGQSPPRV